MTVISLSGRVLLRSVVYIVLATGLMMVLFASLATISSGTFDPKLLAGIVYIALAIWLSRGSGIARAALAFLFFVGLVACVALFFVYVFFATPNDSRMPIQELAILTITTAASGFGFWVLVLSKAFRSELTLAKADYSKRKGEEKKLYYESLGEEYKE